jgi:hypothetical protein
MVSTSSTAELVFSSIGAGWVCTRRFAILPRRFDKSVRRLDNATPVAYFRSFHSNRVPMSRTFCLAIHDSEYIRLNSIVACLLWSETMIPTSKSQHPANEKMPAQQAAAIAERNLPQTPSPKLLDQLTAAAQQRGHAEETVTEMAEWCRRFGREQPGLQRVSTRRFAHDSRGRLCGGRGLVTHWLGPLRTGENERGRKSLPGSKTYITGERFG